ncbi:class I SAM-dependent methyltransferase [Mycobacterium sp.]|uniref:class I SAM-dependent methyltransferase n=1 Tax=Mycobacterium sp. TaxID=1785 RepID=UPI002B58F466|nr:class I SAM-dependent methyltransferase [Mycobacterium sp.]HME50168.1 class I SAM-dependent methyltransferase [Mycobacterium sp.]
MVRTEDDSWDLASSVGATATMVAAARALATREPEPLIHDPFAEPLVKAVGIEFFCRLVEGELTASDIDDDAEFNIQRLVHMMAVRTRFFDDFFTDAGGAGIRQAVILAAGLDSRPYRLNWPDGTAVYEVDMPDVIEFKTRTLAGLGAEPTAQRRTVAVDLREDWPAALRRCGFDEAAPTAWSAEGLLMYLPPDAQDRLFDNITALSAPGSRLATEYHPDPTALISPRVTSMTSKWGEHGFDVDLQQLWYTGERNHVVDYLTGHGWQVSAQTRADLFAAAGLPLPDGELGAPLRNSIAVNATKN